MQSRAESPQRFREQQSTGVELVARYGSDEALGVIYDARLGTSVLPNGGRAASCSDCAAYIRSQEPNTAIYGFWSRDNTGWAGAILCDGHDFAVVSGRYIVDPWIVETEPLSDRAVFDLEDPTDLLEIRRIYGDPSSWRLVEAPVGYRFEHPLSEMGGEQASDCSLEDLELKTGQRLNYT